MQTIDLSDLPEPVVKAVESLVLAIRNHLRDCHVRPDNHSNSLLPIWDGDMLGNLKRSEIYKRAGD